MKKRFIIILMLVSVLFILSCSSSKELVLEQPQEGKCLLIGAMLVENNGVEGKYEAINKNITVVIAGKYEENGEEITEGYRVKTDENGYFVLQNVPAGAYAVKGFEVDVGFDTRLYITSRWDGNVQVFYSINTIIDYTVRIWPEPHTDKLINMQINYFAVDQAQRVTHNRFNQLKDRTGVLPDRSYTMADPVSYFKNKYPDWGWF
jgi:hypothetical protein